MKKLKGIVVLILLLALLTSPIAVLASDISGAKYYATIIVSNNSTATTNVAVNCTISTANLIAGNYLNSSANNCVVRSSGGADLPFMPSVNATYPWCIWVPSIGQDAHLADILYTANSTGGEIRYFPGAAGMSTLDSGTLELGDNFTVEQSGWFDTSFSASGVEDFRTFTEVDPNNKLTVTDSTATGVDVDLDENVYLYKDYGANYFDALDIDFEIYIDSASLDNAQAGMAITNTVGTFANWAVSDLTADAQRVAGPAYRINLWRGVGVANDFYVCAADTPYYCTLERAAGNNAVDCKIWTDPARGGAPLDTLNVAGYGVIKWRYAYGFVNYNVPLAGRDWDGYVKDLGWAGIGGERYLVAKQGAFGTYISGSENITSSITGVLPVIATGVTSGEHIITTSTNVTALFYGIFKDKVNADFPIVDDLALNAPLWHIESDASPFTTKDVTEHPCTVTEAVWGTNGYFFDKDNDVITVPAQATINNLFNGGGTALVWINPASGGEGGAGRIFDKDSALKGWYLHPSSEAGGEVKITYMCRFTAGGGFLLWETAATEVPINTWSFVAVTFDSSTHANNALIYVDGVSVGLAVRVGGGTGNNKDDSGEVLTIGNNVATTTTFDNIIGEGGLYSAILSPPEIMAYYNASKWKYDGSDEYFHYNLVGAGVPGTPTNWTSSENYSMMYMGYQDIEIDGIQQQRIEWEYSENFTDLSGKGHWAIPSFRTTSSDPDVSAVFTSFLPVSEAKAPSYALEDAPPFIETVPTIVSGWGVTPPAGTFPLAGVIVAIANATATPPQLPLLLIAAFVIIACSLTISATMRRYGSGSLIIKALVITALMGIFIAIGNFGIDFWMLFVFLIIAVALSMGSKQVGWQ